MAGNGHTRKPVGRAVFAVDDVAGRDLEGGARIVQRGEAVLGALHGDPPLLALSQPRTIRSSKKRGDHKNMTVRSEIAGQ
jgi:hypothetical protein